MTGHERPWWSSGSEPGSRVDPGPAADDARQHTASGDGHRHHDEHDGEVCAVCPICTALRLVGEVRPDLMVHLAEAARHLTLAAKTIVDAQAAGYRSRGLEHIPLDDDPA